MEALQSWALCIVFSAVGALLVHTLSPRGATEKAMRVMVALFLLSAILSPFLTGKGISLNMPAQDSGKTEDRMDAALEKVNRSLAEQVRRSMEEQARGALAQIGITDAEIQVDMDIAGDSVISITELKIFLPHTHGGEERLIQDQLEQSLGCPVTVEPDEP